MLSRLALAFTLLLTAGPSLSADDVEYRIETVADGLEHPWSLAFLPDNRMLLTERAGRLRLIENGELHPEPIAGVPPAYAAVQGGLFEVLPHPDWEDNGWLYLSLAYGSADENTTIVVRGRLQGHELVDVETVFTAIPSRATPVHFGGRMAFLPDNTLLIGVGDGFDYREQAQKRDSHLGSLVRIHDDGSIPEDNPFVDEDGHLSEIYSYGHRNIQGIVHDAETDTIWSHEHGPRGGDELNIIKAGANYGWPVATHGRDYSGTQITPHRSVDGMEDPLRVWTPSIAPAGLSQYRGHQFPEWDGDLLITALMARTIIHVRLDGTTIQSETRRFEEIGERLRDVRTGPDGALYILTDSPDGKLLRISRRGDLGEDE